MRIFFLFFFDYHDNGVIESGFDGNSDVGEGRDT